MTKPADVLPLDTEEFGLIDVAHLLWKAKLTVAFMVLPAMIAAFVYVSLVPRIFRTQVTMVSVNQGAGLGGAGQLGGLASIAGISLPGQSASQEPIAVLRSRDLLRGFIEERKLLPVLFSDKWDSAANRWKAEGSGSPPDLLDAISLFDRKIRSIEDDKKNGLVVLSINWTDPEAARDWAVGLVKMANARLRVRAIEQSERNVKYLNTAIANTGVAAVQQAIGRILESEIQKELLARGNEEFAFRVVDGAEVPKHPVSPRKAIFLLVSALLGAVAAIILVLLRDAVVPRWQFLRAASRR